MESPSAPRAAAKAAVVAVAALVPYLLTRTRDFGGDDTVFAAAVDRWLSGHPEWPLLLHPHHLAYNPLVAGVAALLGRSAFLPDVGAAVAAACAALTAGLVTWVLLVRGEREGVALLAGACCAASGGLWMFATRMEVYSLAALGVAAWAAALGRREPHPPRVGAAGAVALLGHLATGLLVLPTAWRLRRRPRELSIALALMLGLPGAVLALAFSSVFGAPDPRAWPGLLAGHSATGLAAPHLDWVLRALRDAVVWRWYRTVPVLEPGAVVVLDLLAVAALVLAALLLAIGVVAVLRRRDPLGITALAGVLAFVPLWALWDAGNVEHAVAALPLLSLVAANGAAALPRRVGEAALGILLATLVAVNGLGSAAGQAVAANSRTLVVADFVHRVVPPDGVVLIGGSERRLRLALGYLSGRRVVDLGVAVASARAQGVPVERALDYWLAAAASAPTAFVPGALVGPGAADVAAEHGLPPAAWRAAAARLDPVGRAVLEPDGLAVREPFVLWEIRVRAGRRASP